MYQGSAVSPTNAYAPQKVDAYGLASSIRKGTAYVQGQMAEIAEERKKAPYKVDEKEFPYQNKPTSQRGLQIPQRDNFLSRLLSKKINFSRKLENFEYN